jgi:hypothetical protein
VIDLVPEIARIHDEPFADSSSIPTTLLARFAREQRKKHSRSNIFNLDDDDEEADELLLTHNAKVRPHHASFRMLLEVGAGE